MGTLQGKRTVPASWALMSPVAQRWGFGSCFPDVGNHPPSPHINSPVPHRFSLSRRRGPSLVLRPQCLSQENKSSSNHASHDYLPLVRTSSPSQLGWGSQAHGALQQHSVDAKPVGAS